MKTTEHNLWGRDLEAGGVESCPLLGLVLPLQIFVTEVLVSNVCRLPYIHKVKFSRYRPGVAQRVGRGIAPLFHDSGTRWGEWSATRTGRTLPPGKTRYSFYRRLVGPQGRSGRAENLVPTGIRSRTVQPVVSSYTDWASRSTPYKHTWMKMSEREYG